MIRKLVGVLIFAILVTMPALADVITVTFTATDLYGSAGETLIFGGTLSNTSGSDVYINAASLNLASSDLSADLTDFVLHAPWTALAAGQSTATFDFFTVTIPSGLPDGDYAGTLTVQGGATLDDDAVLGSAYFTVQVGPESTGVPEPGSWLQLGTALAGLVSCDPPASPLKIVAAAAGVSEASQAKP